MAGVTASNNQDFDDKWHACIASTADLRAERKRCGDLQQIFEQEFCEWRVILITKCDQMDTCMSNAVKAHLTEVNRVRTISNQPVLDAKMISYLQCLVDKLTEVGDTNMDDWLAVCSGVETADLHQLCQPAG